MQITTLARPPYGKPGDTTFRPSSLTIRHLTIGEGRPKVIVPITAHSAIEATQMASRIGQCDAADLAEFRIDYLSEPSDALAIGALCQRVRAELRGKPLLVTFRTQSEGGEQAIADADYEQLYLTIIDTAAPDLIDVQSMIEAPRVQRLVHHAHEKGIAVIMSHHNFDKTPADDVLMTHLLHQQSLGADIVKIAAMPHSPGDTLRLM